MNGSAFGARRGWRAGAVVALAGLAGAALADPRSFVAVNIDTDAGRPMGLAVVDIDHDGDNDIVAALYDQGIWWYENQGGPAPTFIKRNIAGAAFPWAVIAADVTHDGNIDVVSISETGVRRHYSNGASPPTWDTNQLLMAQGEDIKAGDIVSDGLLDFVVASTFTNEAIVYRNLGGTPTNFTRLTFPSEMTPSGVAVGDIDRNGDLDFVVARQGDGTLRWEQNSGGVAYTHRDIAGVIPGVRSVDLGDLDADGDLDIAASSDTGAGTYIFLSDGAPTPTFTLLAIVPTPAEEIRIVDVDGDGDLDILAAQKSLGRVTWLDNNGASPPTFVPRLVYSASGISAAVGARINADGLPDIVVSVSDENRIVLLRQQKCPADLNGDGMVGAADLSFLLGSWGACP